MVNRKAVADRGSVFADAAKHAAENALAGKVPKDALHHVEPGCGSGSEVNVDSLVTLQPAVHSLVLVAGMVVGDWMDLFVWGGARSNARTASIACGYGGAGKCP